MPKIKNKTSIKLPLTEAEKASLRKQKIKRANILDFGVDELEVLLNAPTERAKEIHALAAFQTVPSIGIKFAEDPLSQVCPVGTSLAGTKSSPSCCKYDSSRIKNADYNGL